MPVVKQKVWVPHSASHMYHLVHDVAQYPDFLPWCAYTTVHYADATHQQATIGVRKGPIRQQFTTRNQCQENQRIDMQCVDGPFRSFSGYWMFTPANSGSWVELHLTFSLRLGWLSRVLNVFFQEAMGQMVSAFVQRANEVSDDQH
jgi:ribosome-associated toxin RatA of RatAB toxin-antitoxin module